MSHTESASSHNPSGERIQPEHPLDEPTTTGEPELREKVKDFCEKHGLREHFIEQDLLRFMATERNKVEELHKILGQKRTTIKQLREQIAAERTSGKAWELVAKGKEGAYVKMEQQIATEREALVDERKEISRLLDQLAAERKRLDWLLSYGYWKLTREKLDEQMLKTHQCRPND
jgi:hypothetical protein